MFWALKMKSFMCLLGSYLVNEIIDWFNYMFVSMPACHAMFSVTKCQYSLMKNEYTLDSSPDFPFIFLFLKLFLR